MPDRPEAVLLVQPPRAEVGQPDLERRLAGVAVDRQVHERQQQPLPDPAAAIAGVDRERRDVRLVDHEPDPAVGDDLVVDRAHEVGGEAVRLELLAVRLGRPRRRERGTLDELDRGQVRDRHRPDPEARGVGRGHRGAPAAPRAPSIATPASAAAARTPRGQRDVLRDERREVVGIARREPRGAGPQERGREPVDGRDARGDAPRPARGRRGPPRPPSRRARARARRRPATIRGGSPARVRTRSDGPAGWSRTSAPPPAAASSASPVAMPTIGMPRAYASALAVARPTRSPVNAPGPVPTTIPPSASSATPSSREQAPRGGRGAPPRGGSPRPTTARPAACRRPRRGRSGRGSSPCR